MTLADRDNSSPTTSRSRSAHQLRSAPRRRTLSPTHVRIDGAEYVNFASNDYLGLTHHPRLIAAARTSLAQTAWAAAPPPLITGYTTPTPPPRQRSPAGRGPRMPSCFPAGTRRITRPSRRSRRSARRRGRSLPPRQARARVAHRRRARDGLAVPRLPAQPPREARAAAGRRGAESTPGGRDRIDLQHGRRRRGSRGAGGDSRQRRPFRPAAGRGARHGRVRRGGAGYAAERGIAGGSPTSRVVTLSKAMGCAGGAVCGSRTFCAALRELWPGLIYSTSDAPDDRGGGEGGDRRSCATNRSGRRACATWRRVRDAASAQDSRSPRAIRRSFRSSWVMKPRGSRPSRKLLEARSAGAGGSAADRPDGDESPAADAVVRTHGSGGLGTARHPDRERLTG